MVHKIRTYFLAIVLEAVEQGYLSRDPLRKLKRPQTKKRKDKSYLTPENIHALRDAMRGFRDRLILDPVIDRDASQ
jgi:hypothetical protein